MSLSEVAPSARAHRAAGSPVPPAATAESRSSGFLADHLSVTTVRVIADSIAALADFGVVGIAAVTDWERLEVIALAGADETEPGLVGQQSLLSSWVSELETAQTCGELSFLPSRDRTPDHAGPAREAGPGVWVPGDRLVATLRSSSAELVGFLWVEEPRTGLRPDEVTRAALEKFARAAGRAVSLAVRRQDLGEQMRLVTATRTVVRHASRELDIDALMEQVCRPLVAGLLARGMWLHVFDGPGSRSTRYDETGRLPLMGPTGEGLARRIAEDAWLEDRVGVVSKARLRGGLLTSAEVASVRAFLDDHDLGSLLFIPIGSGPECLGSMILARDLDEVLWSEGEIEVARDLGHDLGRAVLNAASFQRERDLVSRLQALDAHKTTLMRTMSHELKSPLAAIQANLDMLDEVAPTEGDARRNLLGASRGAARLARVVDDLLVLAEAGDPHRPLAVAPVDLAGLVEDAAELKRTEALRAGVTLRVEAADGDLSVLGSALDLELVVTNLLGNAVKYSPGGGTVDLRLSHGPGRVVLSCADQGIGMSPEDRVCIFEEFFRSSQSQARAQPGTGLGLSIVAEIVRRHGGTIEVTSTLGEGSTFRVDLPAASTGGTGRVDPSAGAVAQQPSSLWREVAYPPPPRRGE